MQVSLRQVSSHGRSRLDASDLSAEGPRFADNKVMQRKRTQAEMTGEPLRKRIAELRAQLAAMPIPLESEEQFAREIALDAGEA